MLPPLKVLHWLTGIVIFIQSIQTAMESASSNIHLTLFAGFEAVAAILFFLPSTKKLGGYTLLAILALATAIHLISEDRPWHLLIYIGAVYAVLRSD